MARHARGGVRVLGVVAFLITLDLVEGGCSQVRRGPLDQW